MATLQETAPRPLRILVVENDHSELQLLMGTLRGEFEVRAARTPEEALARLPLERFDVILAAKDLPRMAGPELLSRARLLQPGCRRVVMGPAMEAGMVLPRIDAGDIHRFVARPVESHQLVACVDALGRGATQSVCRCVILDSDVGRREALADSMRDVPELAVVPPVDAVSIPAADLVLLVEPRFNHEVEQVIATLGGPERRRCALFVGLEMDPDKDAGPFLLGGADEVVWLPLRARELLLRYQSWRSRRASREEAERVRADVLAQQPFIDIVGKAPAMQQVFQSLHRAAATDSTILLSGETGTGKELLARAIHALSPRREAPFLAVNLSALPETLIESELFGHEPGAFTGAVSKRPGRLEAVSGGTLFLDEIGDLQPGVQVKLLRVLQERVFERLGSTKAQKTDFRLVCATHRNLEELVAEGSFREDLYYRINVVRIEVPSLRERGSDVELLAELFLRRFCKRMGKDLSFSPEAREAMAHHPWPGNVRELEHVIERGVALARDGGVLGPEILVARPARRNFPEEVKGSLDLGRGLREVLTDIERAILVETLQRCNGNQVTAARKLKIPRATLQHRLRRLGL